MKARYIDHFKKTLIIAYPVILSQLGHVLVGVFDNLMVGQIGKLPLAAASLANSVFFVFFMFGLGVSMGMTPLVAAADGENDSGKAGNVLKHGFYVNTLLGFILVAVLFLGAPVLRYLNQPEEVVALAIPYLWIIAASILPMMVFQSFRQFSEGLSFTKQAMYITILANMINIAGNYVLIYGKWGMPALGLNGAGWATLFSRILMAVLMALFVFNFSRFKNYLSSINWRIWEFDSVRKILNIGVPAGFQFIFEVGVFGAAGIMMGWFGTESLAAHQIALNLASITYMMASGIAAAGTVRVGNQLGKKDIQSLREAGFTAFGMAGIFMGVCAIIFIFGRNFLPSLYIEDASVIQMSASLLIVGALFQLSDGIQVVGAGVLRGISDAKIPTIICFIAYWVLGLPMSYVLGHYFGLGPLGIWYGLWIGLSVAAVLLFIRFHQQTKRLMKLPESPTLQKHKISLPEAR